MQTTGTSPTGYVKALKTALEGKDPRALKLEPCTALLSFPGQGQITIELQRALVRVRDGDQRDRDDGAPTCFIRTTLTTWIDVCAGKVPLRDAPIEILGDHRVLAAIGQLVDQRRSAISARLFQ